MLSIARYLGTRSPRSDTREVAPGIRMLRMDTAILRKSGMCVTPYLVDDVLVDTGPTHLGPTLRALLADRPIRAIALTHHHEDHSGNAGSIARDFGAPVYLRDLAQRDTEGLPEPPLYRRVFWGIPALYDPIEMPEEIPTSKRTLLAIPTPGHSATHTAFFDSAEGVLFAGDLYLSPGPSAVMRYEDPFALVRSLRRVAELGPRLLVSAHQHVIENPVSRLVGKADRVEAAIHRVLDLSATGLPPSTITRKLFPKGQSFDFFFRTLTWGEYHRANFVMAVLTPR